MLLLILKLVSSWLSFLLASESTIENASTVRGKFQIKSAFVNPIPGFELCVISDTDDDSATATDLRCQETPVVTDENGKAVLELNSNAPFLVRGRKPPFFQDLYIFGISTTRSKDFEYITYMGTRAEAKILAKWIHQPYNASLGYIVVGMDRIVHKDHNHTDLEPAVGASATITGIKGGLPFVYNAIGLPIHGNTVNPHGSSFVTWPGMQPGNGHQEQGMVHVSPPTNMDCEVSPGTKSNLRDLPIRVFEDAVTVVSFTCQ